MEEQTKEKEVVTSPGKMKIDPLIHIENMRKESEELNKQLSLVKEQLHFKNKTGLYMLEKVVEMTSSTISKEICKRCQQIFEEAKMMETITILV